MQELDTMSGGIEETGHVASIAVIALRDGPEEEKCVEELCGRCRRCGLLEGRSCAGGQELLLEGRSCAGDAGDAGCSRTGVGGGEGTLSSA